MVNFPQAPLGIKASLNLGSWTDMSHYIYQRAPVNITRGRANESASLSPSSCKMTLNNRDGRFTARNPTGAWYGTISQNTPFRLSVPNSLVGGGTYLRIEDDAASWASTPDAAGLQITGDLRVTIDMAPTGWVQSTLAYKWGGTGTAWWLGLNGDGTVSFSWNDGSSIHNVNSTLPLPMLARVSLQVEFTPNATGFITFSTAPVFGGTYTQLGAQIAQAGSAVSAAVGQPLLVGHAAIDTTTPQAIQGQIYQFQLMNRGGGATTVEASPIFSAQAAGTTSWADAQGNTWTLGGTAEISDQLYRYHGELGSLPKASDPSVTDIYSQAEASGILRRLSQGQAVAGSALYRAFVRQTGASAPVAYWPCEDSAGSTQIASALGGPAMTVSGTTTFAASSAFACSAPLPQPGSSVWTGAVPAGTTTWTDNVLRFLLNETAGSIPNNTILARMRTNGSVRWCELVYTTGGGLTLTGYDSGGAQSFTSGPVAFGIDNQLVRVSVELTTSGANVGWGIVTVVPGATTGSQFTGTLTGATIGAVQSVQFNHGNVNLGSTVIGHVTVAAKDDSIFSQGSPMNAWLGETAGNRYARLCAEEGINSRIWGFPATSTAMGFQTVQTVATLLQECETTDQGMQYEPRTCLGLGYVTRASLYNQAPDAVASFSGAALAAAFSSTADDQLTVNDVTVTNVDGSSARAVLTSGAMSVNSPPAGIGRIDTSVSVNAAFDSDLGNQAGWMLWVRSVNDDRYPAIPFDMARSQTPQAIPLLDVGQYLQITGTPSWLPPGPVRQLCAGFDEALGPFGIWTIKVNGIPEAPYEVPVAGTAHADTDGSALAAAITSGATAMQVYTANTASRAWTTAGGDFPFDVLMGGEQMTVTAIAGAGPSVVQSAQGSNTGAIALTVSLPAATTAGNTVVALISASGTTTNPTVSSVTLGGAAGNFASILASANTEAQIDNWADLNCAGGQTAVQVNVTGGTGTLAITMYVLELAGVSSITPPDKTGHNGATSAFSTWNTGGTGTLSQPAEILLAIVTGVSTTAGITVTGAAAPWVNLPQVTQGDATNTCYSMAGYQLTPSNAAGLYAGSFSVAAAYQGTIVALRAAQAFTVTRAVNGVVKAHSAGETLALFSTPVAAL